VEVEKKAEDEIRREVEQRLQEIELLRREAQARGLSFESLSEEELVRKVSRESAQSPYFYGQSWTSGTTPGSSASLIVTMANPDPVGYYPLFVTIFFGMANFLNEVGLGPAGRHPEWPYLSSAPFGLVVGASTSQSFAYQTPTGIPLGTYTGNAVLWRGQYFDQGSYLDRTFFQVTLS
jgi:hypothetical protein